MICRIGLHKWSKPRPWAYAGGVWVRCKRCGRVKKKIVLYY